MSCNRGRRLPARESLVATPVSPTWGEPRSWLASATGLSFSGTTSLVAARSCARALASPAPPFPGADARAHGLGPSTCPRATSGDIRIEVDLAGDVTLCASAPMDRWR